MDTKNLTKKINWVVIVDDDDASTFICKVVVKKIIDPDTLSAFHCSQDALDFIIAKIKKGASQPDLIILDVNLPMTTGWDFIQNYENLGFSMENKPVVVMMTAMDNPANYAKAKASRWVDEVKLKPITKQMITSMLLKHFPEHAQGQCLA